jgi:hypothetical protein
MPPSTTDAVKLLAGLKNSRVILSLVGVEGGGFEGEELIRLITFPVGLEYRCWEAKLALEVVQKIPVRRRGRKRIKEGRNMGTTRELM